MTSGIGLTLWVGPRGLCGVLVAAYAGLCMVLSGTECGLVVGLLLLCHEER